MEINKTEKELAEETGKWLIKAKEERKSIILIDNSKENMLKNIDAYISDSEHFTKKEDLVRAFEAVIWACAWIEIGLELGIFRKSEDYS